MNWLLFSIGAPVLWALTNVLDAAVRRYYVKSDLALMWSMAFIRLPLVLVFFWAGGFGAPRPDVILWMMLGGMLWIFPFHFYFQSIEKEDPSRVALFLQLIPVFAFLIAFFFIQETLSLQQGVAFLILMMGGFLAAFKKGEDQWHFSRAFLWIGLASLLWAASDVIFKAFVHEFDHLLTAYAYYFGGGGLVVMLLLFFKKYRQTILKSFLGLSKRGWIILIVTDSIGVLGSLFFAYALGLGKVSLTTVIVGIQPLLVILFNRLLAPVIPEVDKESLEPNERKIKWIAFVIIIAGLILLNF